MKFFILYCLLFYLLSATAQGNSSHEDELRKELMKDYNKNSLPRNLVSVELDFSVLQFDMDEKKQVMEIDMWVHMVWQDPRLQWNYGKHANIKQLAFPPKQLWTPDITLYNHGDIKSVIPYVYTLIYASSNGTIIWVPPAHVKATCILDMTYWPDDEHNCTMKFGSWVHSGRSIDLNMKRENVHREEYDFVRKGDIDRSAWKIMKTGIFKISKKYDCCVEEYHSITAWLIMKRNASAFRWLIKAPVIVLAIFTFVIFLLPVASGEKIILGGIILILDFLMLLEVTNLIGFSPNHTPLMVKFLSTQLVLSSVTLIVSVIVLRISRNPNGTAAPQSVKKITSIFSKYLFIKSNELVKTNEQEVNTFPEDEKDDWLKFASVVDRTFLILFIVIFFINIIFYSSVL